MENTTEMFASGLLLGAFLIFLIVIGLAIATGMIALDSYGKDILCEFFRQHKDTMTDKNWIGNVTRYRCI